MAEPDLHRRAFLRGRSPKFNKAAIHPPWSLPFADFIDACERCDDCAIACPEGIIIKGDGAYPEVDFSRGECTFCGKCAESCEANAFASDDPRNASSAWGLVAKILPNCLSMNQVMCRACGDHCDVGAIRFQLKLGGNAEPLIDDELCTGCGACLYVCPNKSIEIKENKLEELAG